jgi:hypothetical protein
MGATEQKIRLLHKIRNPGPTILPPPKHWYHSKNRPEEIADAIHVGYSRQTTCTASSQYQPRSYSETSLSGPPLSRSTWAANRLGPNTINKPKTASNACTIGSPSTSGSIDTLTLTPPLSALPLVPLASRRRKIA